MCSTTGIDIVTETLWAQGEQEPLFKSRLQLSNISSQSPKMFQCSATRFEGEAIVRVSKSLSFDMIGNSLAI